MGPTSLSWYLEGTGDLYLHLKIKGKEENLGRRREVSKHEYLAYKQINQ